MASSLTENWKKYLSKCHPEVFESVENEGSKKTEKKFLSLLDSYLDLTKKKDDEYHNKLLKLYDKLRPGYPYVLDKLLRILTAVEIGNDSWAKREMKEFLMSPPEKIYFSLEFANKLSVEEKNHFWLKYIDILKFLTEKMEDDRLFQMFLNYMSYLISKPELEEVVQDNNLSYSLANIRKLSASINFGQEYIGFWYAMFLKRSIEKEALDYIKKNLEDYVKNLSIDSIWLTEFYYPNDTKNRKKILKVYRRLIRQKHPYYRYLALKLTRDEKKKRFFSTIHNEAKKPFFQRLRDFSWDMLKEKRLVYFAIYNLLSIGDKNQKLLEVVKNDRFKNSSISN